MKISTFQDDILEALYDGTFEELQKNSDEGIVQHALSYLEQVQLITTQENEGRRLIPKLSPAGRERVRMFR